MGQAIRMALDPGGPTVSPSRVRGCLRRLPCLAWAGLLAVQLGTLPTAGTAATITPADVVGIARSFEDEVRPVKAFSDTDSEDYAAIGAQELLRAHALPEAMAFVAIVDRNPAVQAILVFLFAADAHYFIGATPVSTGRVGAYDHFETPTGVFDHSPANPDFRAEGTFNENGIRGYGLKGMRIFDLGWQQALRGWGDGGLGQMRLQMHSTDPDRLEARLGTVQSKGCIRIPATLDTWFDLHGILDAGYDDLPADDPRLWVVRKDRRPFAGAGRYVVVVDTGPIKRMISSPLRPEVVTDRPPGSGAFPVP